MKMEFKIRAGLLLGILALLPLVAACAAESDRTGFVPLFPDDGVPKGWVVRAWNDVSKPVESTVQWQVKDGVLHGSPQRGTWLMSQRQYSDFVLTYEFKLGARGNSGCALRAPLTGDPAFDGMELQMVDFRYNTGAAPSELTGGLYRAVAPLEQVYKPTQWNRYEIALKGTRLRVVLNGRVIQDLDLDKQNQAVKRHNGTSAPPIGKRPGKGHIGFQELSRDRDRVQIRNAFIKELTDSEADVRQTAHPMATVAVADAHLHLLDFLQNSAYLLNGKEVPPKASRTLPFDKTHLRLELLLAKMDQANVSHAMVSGLPFVKKWSEDDPYRSTYYLDTNSRVTRARDTDYVIALAFLSFKAADPARYEREFPRLSPFICGFNETDLGAVDMIAKRIIEFPGLWKGIGEIMSRHDDLTNLTTGERPRANHPALFRIFDFAGRHGLPISIHHNIAPVSPGRKDTGMRYLAELLDAFEEFPKTTFIWAHAGISRRVVVDDLVELLDEQVLAKHKDHVLLDLSWVVYEDYLVARDARGNVIRDKQGHDIIRQAWLNLIHKYPNNFLLGSDKVGDFTTYKREIRKFDALLGQLKPEVRNRVARSNWLRIVPKQGLTLPANYKYPETRYTRKSPPLRTPPSSRAGDLSAPSRPARELIILP